MADQHRDGQNSFISLGRKVNENFKIVIESHEMEQQYLLERALQFHKIKREGLSTVFAKALIRNKWNDIMKEVQRRKQAGRQNNESDSE